jgi:hypothetical protein
MNQPTHPYISRYGKIPEQKPGEFVRIMLEINNG